MGHGCCVFSNGTSEKMIVRAHCDYTLQSEITHTAKEKSWVIVSNREWDVPNASFRLVKDPKGTSSSSKIVSKSWVIVSGPHPDNFFKKYVFPSHVIICSFLGPAPQKVHSKGVIAMFLFHPGTSKSTFKGCYSNVPFSARDLKKYIQRVL